MSTLPQTGATELVLSQAVPETAVNEIARYLDANATRSIIEDRDLTAPPGSCADGARYLVAASPTGAWSGKAGLLAIAVGTNASNGWLFQTVAVEGFHLYIRDENIEIEYDGAAWGTPASGAAAESSDAQVWTGSDTTTRVTPRRLASSSAPQTLTDGATINWDMSLGFNAKVTIAGNRTFAAPTNLILGRSYALEVIQDGTGSRTITWNAAFDWGSAAAPTLSTTAAKRDIVFLYCYDASTPKLRAVFNKSA